MQRQRTSSEEKDNPSSYRFLQDGAPWGEGASGIGRSGSELALVRFVSHGIVAATLAAAPDAVPWDELLPYAGDTPRIGGFSVVVHAHWKAKRKDVAVKLLKIAGLSDKQFEETLESLVKEARVLALARDARTNDHVVQMYGVSSGVITPAWHRVLGHLVGVVSRNSTGLLHGETEAVALVMHWETGGTLADLLHSPSARGPWGASTLERLRVLLGIADGLWHLHRGSPAIIAGDIKSQNVLLRRASDSGALVHPLLADFGMATISGTASNSVFDASAVSMIAYTHELKGTWPYMAPEMFNSSTSSAVAANRRTDMYAFGTLAWEVLTGRIPWELSSRAERLVAVRSGLTLDFSFLPTDLPSRARSLIESCVNFSNDSRPAINDAIEGLNESIDELQSSRIDILIHALPDGAEIASVLCDSLRAGGLSVSLSGVAQQPPSDVLKKTLVVLSVVSRGFIANPAAVSFVASLLSGKKPTLIANSEPGRWNDWATPSLALALGFTKRLYVDVSSGRMAAKNENFEKEAIPTMWKLLRELLSEANAAGAASVR